MLSTCYELFMLHRMNHCWFGYLVLEKKLWS